mmetsp:Transcript_34684/g.89045  ORF Transcript_34684/g.89045 Transcript_34684/m.89045 type:complete len:205 (+) Transcript_34684:1479-2093(+)
MSSEDSSGKCWRSCRRSFPRPRMPSSLAPTHTASFAHCTLPSPVAEPPGVPAAAPAPPGIAQKLQGEQATLSSFSPRRSPMAPERRCVSGPPASARSGSQSPPWRRSASTTPCRHMAMRTLSLRMVVPSGTSTMVAISATACSCSAPKAEKVSCCTSNSSRRPVSNTVCSLSANISSSRLRVSFSVSTGPSATTVKGTSWNSRP